MSDRLRLASFNLETLDSGPRVDPPLESRFSILRPMLERLNADILCLQEVNAQRSNKSEPRRLAALDKCLEGTAYARHQRAHSLGQDGKGLADVHNLVVLSRLPLLSSQSHWHSHVDAPQYRLRALPEAGLQPITWERPLLHVTIRLPSGKCLEVINLHLRAPLAADIPGMKESAFVWKTSAAWAEGFYMASMKRAGQALEARLLVDRLFDADSEALIAVVGDFNAEANETPLRLISAGSEDTGNGLLAGRALLPLHRHAGRDAATVVHHGRRITLDHIVVSRALIGHLRSFEVQDEGLGDELIAAGIVKHPTESYHAPICAEFAF